MNEVVSTRADTINIVSARITFKSEPAHLHFEAIRHQNGADTMRPQWNQPPYPIRFPCRPGAIGPSGTVV